ncbi:unnamed protein product [Linum trigynum]|uniref:Uncharacterized protein n=1 Tax=Linum trigynum TaxID=586398 RepID=A0AAV2EX03_9ROSI
MPQVVMMKLEDCLILVKFGSRSSCHLGRLIQCKWRIVDRREELELEARDQGKNRLKPVWVEPLWKASNESLKVAMEGGLMTCAGRQNLGSEATTTCFLF